MNYVNWLIMLCVRVKGIVGAHAVDIVTYKAFIFLRKIRIICITALRLPVDRPKHQVRLVYAKGNCCGVLGTPKQN